VFSDMIAIFEEVATFRPAENFKEDLQQID